MPGVAALFASEQDSLTPFWPELQHAFHVTPALNIFQMGFPVKIMLTLTMLGLTFPLLRRRSTR